MSTQMATGREQRPGGRFLRVVLPALLILIWLVAAGVGGPYFGKVDEVSSNDQTSFLPASAEATRVQDRLGLSDAQLHPAREVLRTCGNMSSATVLFILQRLLADEAAPDPARVVAMAFGPGLTAETALLRRRTG